MINLICLECGSVIHSSYPGEYVVCGCPNEASIDETMHYIRYGAKDPSKTMTEENGIVFKEDKRGWPY